MKNSHNAEPRKSLRYEQFSMNIERISVKCGKVKPSEVYAFDNIPAHSRQTIPYLDGKRIDRETFKSFAKIAISTSYSYRIFNRHGQLEWLAFPSLR